MLQYGQCGQRDIMHWVDTKSRKNEVGNRRAIVKRSLIIIGQNKLTVTIFIIDIK